MVQMEGQVGQRRGTDCAMSGTVHARGHSLPQCLTVNLLHSVVRHHFTLPNEVKMWFRLGSVTIREYWHDHSILIRV